MCHLEVSTAHGSLSRDRECGRSPTVIGSDPAVISIRIGYNCARFIDRRRSALSGNLFSESVTEVLTEIVADDRE